MGERAHRFYHMIAPDDTRGNSANKLCESSPVRVQSGIVMQAKGTIQGSSGFPRKLNSSKPHSSRLEMAQTQPGYTYSWVHRILNADELNTQRVMCTYAWQRQTMTCFHCGRGMVFEVQTLEALYLYIWFWLLGCICQANTLRFSSTFKRGSS